MEITTKHIRVIIADDHDMVRKGIRTWLEAEADIEVIHEASGGIEAIAKAIELKPDVILLDLHMPDKDGLSVIRDLRAAGFVTPILVMTGYERQRARDVLESGANGFLNKEEKRDRIIDAIRWAASGERGTWISPSTATELLKTDMELDTIGLTKTEMRILGLLELTNVQLSKKLFLSEGTVKNHVTNIYSKLNVSTRMEAIAWARKHGLIRFDA